MIYAVSCCVPLSVEDSDVVTVEADSPEEAAIKGIAAIEDHMGSADAEYCETIFTCPLDVQKMITFQRTNAVERVPEEFQCCGGGGGFTGDGHSGHCPNRPRES